MLFLLSSFFWQAFLQESGKISKQKSQARPRSQQKRPTSTSSTKASSSKPSPSGEKQDNNADTRPGTASSVGRKVNEIFEVCLVNVSPLASI